MARSKIGFIVSHGGNPTGIGDYILDLDNADIPVVIMANDATTGLSDILNMDSSVEHIMVYRVVRDKKETYAVPRYDLPPYEAALSHWNLISQYFPQEVVNNKHRIWIQPINEVDKNRATWLGNFAVEISKIANSRGYKVLLFGWSSGEPEPEHWRDPAMLTYLRYCEANPGRAGVALHEYDFAMNGMSKTYPFHAGRFEELFRACDENDIKRPPVAITEWGWAYDNIPSIDQCMDDVDWAARLYAQHEEIIGAGIWYLGAGFKDIANKVNNLMDPVSDYTRNTVLPDPPTQDEPDNHLLNPSFEYGWYHPDDIPELQIPNDWQFGWAGETVPNPYDQNPWSVFRRPEVRTLPKWSLPDHEQDLFVLHGNYCVKVFKGSGSLFYSMAQDIISPGSWKLTVRVYPDLVVGYNPDGTKIFADDPDSCIIWLDIDGEAVSQEHRPTPGQYNDLVFEFETDDVADMQIFFMQPFALQNNGVFLDNWRLEDMSGNCDAREPYNREVWVLPGNTTLEQYLTVAEQAFNESKRTLSFSYDDAGIGCGLESKKAVLFGIDPEFHDEFMAWYAIEYPGTAVEFRPFPDTTPR